MYSFVKKIGPSNFEKEKEKCKKKKNSLSR
jgi:hypothetical protein